jgi:hypothetical protein
MTLKGQPQLKYKKRQLNYHYDLELLVRTYMESGKTYVELEKLAKAIYGNQAVKYKEIRRLLTGERKFPRPSWVAQLATVLNVPMSEIVKPSNPEAT